MNMTATPQKKKAEDFNMPDCRTSALTYEQVYHFMEEGYVVVPGLISKEIAERADRAAFEVTGLDRNDPLTWSSVKHSTFSKHPDLMGVYTPQFLTAAAQLASSDPHMFAMSRVPLNAYVISLPPTPRAEWGLQGPHIDGSGNWNSIVNSFPRPWLMFSMIYLHDVPKHGGNTCVFPKSHRKFQALLRSEPERYRFMAQMNDDWDRVDLGEPVELIAKAGDVAFLDQMMVHAGSNNLSHRPRFAMNMKW